MRHGIVAAFTAAVFAVLPTTTSGTLPGASAAGGPAVATSGVQPSAPAPSDEVAATPLDVDIVDIEPLVLTHEDTAEVTVRLTNTSGTAVDAVTLDLVGQEWTPNTRSSLVRWLDLDLYNATRALASEQVEELAAGASTTVTFELEPSAFAFNTWGPRGIEARATLDDDRSISARERSWILWWNEPAVESTSVGILAPVALTAEEIVRQDAARAEALLGLGHTPGVTPIVDPSLIAPEDEPAASAGSPDPDLGTDADAVENPATDPSGAFSPRADLRTAAFLPWGNADADALLREAPGLYHEAEEESRAAAEENTAPVVTWLDVPTQSLVPLEPTAAPDAAIGDVVVAASSTVPATASLTYTPSALVAAGTPFLMLDDDLSRLLVGTVQGEEEMYDLSPLNQRQLLAAVTAVITRERPFDGRIVMGSLPWDGTEDAGELLDVLATVPWVEPVTLEDVLATAPRELALEFPESAPAPFGTISARMLTEIAETTENLDGIASLGPEAQDDAAVHETLLAALGSRALREDPDYRERILAAADETVERFRSGAEIVGPADVNMISRESELPVMVTNNLDVPLSVTVTLAPSDPRMQSREPVDVTLPAEGTTRVAIPINGVGWGDFNTVASLSTSEGFALSDDFSIRVRLRADWEDWAVIALVALGAVTFVVGIWRTIRRNRATNRSEEIEAAAAEFDALAEASAAEAEAEEAARQGKSSRTERKSERGEP